MALHAAEMIDLAVATRAYVSFADFGDGNARPAMWISLNWADDVKRTLS